RHRKRIPIRHSSLATAHARIAGADIRAEEYFDWTSAFVGGKPKRREAKIICRGRACPCPFRACPRPFRACPCPFRACPCPFRACVPARSGLVPALAGSHEGCPYIHQVLSSRAPSSPATT